MARILSELIQVEASKFKRKGEDVEISKLVGAVKVSVDELGIHIRVSSSPSLEWHLESGDQEQGANAILTVEQSQALRAALEKAETAPERHIDSVLERLK